MERNQHAISREKTDKLFRCNKSSPGEPVKINLCMPLILSNTRSHECPLKARGKRGLVTRDSSVRRRYLSEWGSVMAATGFESSASSQRSGTARFGCQGDPRSAILDSWPTTTVFYTGTNLSPSSTTTFDHDSRLLIPTQLILVSRAVAVRFAFPSFRTRTERERCTRVVLSSSEKFGIFFFFSIRFPGIFHPRYNFTYKSMRNLNFFESLTFLFLVDKKKNR